MVVMGIPVRPASAADQSVVLCDTPNGPVDHRDNPGSLHLIYATSGEKNAGGVLPTGGDHEHAGQSGCGHLGQHAGATDGGYQATPTPTHTKRTAQFNCRMVMVEPVFTFDAV